MRQRRWRQWWVAVIAALGLGASAAPAPAQSGPLYWQCVTPSPERPGGGSCPVNSLYPLPTTAGGGVAPAPVPLTSTQVSAAPTALTFVSVLAANAARKGCLVQNVGTTLGSVFFGPTGSATVGTSFALGSQASISCASGAGGVLTDNVAATCASGTCAFIINSQ